MMFLLTYLKQEVNISQDEASLNNDNTHIHHIFPFCCLKPWPIGRYVQLAMNCFAILTHIFFSELIHRCKHGILQYTFVRPCTTVISL